MKLGTKAILNNDYDYKPVASYANIQDMQVNHTSALSHFIKSIIRHLFRFITLFIFLCLTYSFVLLIIKQYQLSDSLSSIDSTDRQFDDLLR